MNSRLTLASDTVRSGPTTNVSESSTQSINFSTAYGHRTCFTQLYKTELYASAYAHIIKAGSGKFQTKVKMKVGTNSLRLVAERSHARCGVQTHDHWSSLLWCWSRYQQWLLYSSLQRLKPGEPSLTQQSVKTNDTANHPRTGGITTSWNVSTVSEYSVSERTGWLGARLW